MGRILVVDDNVDTCKVLSAFLSRAGHEVACVNSVAEAIDALEAAGEAARPDVIIVDLMMPHESGLELIRQVRDHPQRNELPIIMYSAVSERRYVHEAMDAGASDYWLKGSIEPRDMEAKLQAFLPYTSGWSEPPDAHPIHA